jgi:hypothetical protein
MYITYNPVVSMDAMERMVINDFAHNPPISNGVVLSKK